MELAGIKIPKLPKLPRVSKKHMPYVGVGVVTALLVAFVLLYGNFNLLDLLYVFDKSNLYKEQTVLFYGDDCQQCGRVDDFIKANKVEEKISFTRLEVFNNSHNANILSDKAQICGLDEDHIGVPFLWEGPMRRCVVGYVDIINFLREKLKTVKNP